MPKDVICTIPSDSVLTLPSSSQVSTDDFALVSRRTIGHLLTSNEAMTCSIYVTIKGLTVGKDWFYIGCTTCNTKVSRYLNPDTEELETGKFSCDRCQKVVSSTHTRYQLYVEAMDDTGTTTFLMFDDAVVQLIHKSAYDLLEQQVEFSHQSEIPPELLALIDRQFVFTVFKPQTSKYYKLNTFKVVKLTEDPAKLLMFHNDVLSMVNSDAPHASNSSDTITNFTNLIEDVSCKSSTIVSVSDSTEELTPPNKKRSFDCLETSIAMEDGDSQLIKQKPKPTDPSLIQEGGQLSSTKVSAKLIPNKEK